MAPVGAKKIAGEVHLDYSKHVTASASCKTNPVDSFLRMENDDVLLLRVNDADEFNVLTPKVRAPEELASKASTLPGRQHSWRRSKRRESRLEV